MEVSEGVARKLGAVMGTAAPITSTSRRQRMHVCYTRIGGGVGWLGLSG